MRVPEGSAHEECLTNAVAVGFSTFAFAASVEAMYSLSKVLLKEPDYRAARSGSRSIPRMCFTALRTPRAGTR